jgi:hypothetical protein
MKAQAVRFSRMTLALTLLLMVGFAVLPLHTAVAAPFAQDAPQEPVTLYLGEYVVENLANGEVIEFEISVPEDATYEFRTVDEDEAVAFDLVITDNAGNELFNDIFGSIQLDLPPGDVTLRFEAVDNARLEFAVLGNIGDMTDDIDQPGILPPGGIYTNDDASDPLYATVSVPETPYPQQVIIFVQPGEDDSFYISADGDDIGYVDIESDESNLLRFWTHGGEVLITAEPYERRSEITLIPFLGGPPALLTLDEPFDGAFPAGETVAIYGLNLEAPFDELTIDVDTAAEEIEITLLDRLYDGDYVDSSFGETTLTVSDISPGVYYVIVETFDPAEENIPVGLLVTGAAGKPLVPLESGVAVAGFFEPGDQDATYFLDIEEPGALVSVALSSDVEDSDFDLEAGFKLDEVIWSTWTIGSDDKMSFVAPFAGRYYIRVLSNSGDGDFALIAENQGLAPAVNINGLTWGSVESGGQAVYRLEAAEAGSLLTIALVAQEDTDLDLRVAGYDEDGYTLAYASSYSLGPSEIIGTVIEESGIYEVEINAEFSDGGNFVVLTRLENPNLIAGQWASEAEASSQFDDEGYSAQQATGAPDTPAGGDFDTAWAPADAEGGEQTLQLTYEHAVVPHAVNIYENFNPGAVAAVEAYDAENDEWVALWEGEAEAVEEPLRIFSPDLSPPNFATDTIRIVLDTDAVEGWNEIDAVELVGRP